MAFLMPVPIAWLAAFPFNQYAGLIVGVVIAATGYSVVWVKSPTIRVTLKALHVGEANLPMNEIQKIDIFKGDQAQVERGPKRNPEAFVVLRGTANKLVKVELQSKLDPTPYWLIGTRNPEVVVQAINRAKA